MEALGSKRRSFRALMIAQFFGAFNDNAFKVLISLFVLRSLPSESAVQFISFIGALFILPFILFSPLAGLLSDRFKKRDVIVITKVLEVAIMVFGLFAMANGSLYWIASVLFLLATHSAFFSPAKYGIMPEILEVEELSKGNGYLEMWTFLAIIMGSAYGGQISHIFHGNSYYAVYTLIAFSTLGAIASLFIQANGNFKPNQSLSKNLFKDSFNAFGEIKKDKWLFLTLIALCFFWFLGAVFQMNVLVYGKSILQLSESGASLLLVVTSVGIGVGSLLAGYLSEKKVEYGLVPLGAIGISIVSLLIGFCPAEKWSAFVLFFVLGGFSGLFIVPLNAYFQFKSPKNQRGKYLAASNIATSLSILAGSGFIWFFGSKLRFDSAQLFFILGIFSVGITIYILKVLPEAFLRLFNFLFAHLVYKIRIEGIENIPKAGGALLVCNHVSYADAVLVLASSTRPIRFIMLKEMYENPVIHPIAKAMNSISISSWEGPKSILKSLQIAKEAIQQGHLVCIFAEGSLTRHGNMLPFNKGFERIMDGVNAPIIPMCLDRVWGSIFSYENGKYIWKWPKTWPYPVTVSFGKEMTASSKANEVRLAVQELTAEAFKLRGANQKKLHIAFIDEVKKRPFKFCMADSSGQKLNYLQTLTGAVLFSQKLFDKEASDNEKVGILLPSSCAGSMANGAVFLAGKVPVNLNFTASKESLDSCIEQCQMKKIITSRIFLKKAKLEERPGMIFFEDLIRQISAKDKALISAALFLLPKFLIKALFVRGNKTNTNELATIIFSSGSTGQPKGVMLSHSNIFSNIEALYQVLKIRDDDIVLGVLPFFHSFGFTATLCLPVGVGLGVVYHANPLDASTIGDLAQKYKATILLGTPTFFSAYVRKCTKEQFASLRYAGVGAEKLKTSLSQSFFEKFNVVPFEGYGTTELSPVVAMAIPDYISHEERVKQIGYKEGKVGHPIPGVAAKVVNPDTFDALPFNTEGLLLIKGPNVMLGYLNNPQKTAEVLKEGWYVTGDIATIDEDGFICITDRLSRFSKIGGEMVPHIKIEEEILEALEAIESVCAVTSVPDEKRGERLVVLYQGEIDIQALWEKLNLGGLPKLWMPKRDDFYQIPAIPILGTGKLDLKSIKSMAVEKAAQNQPKNEE